MHAWLFYDWLQSLDDSASLSVTSSTRDETDRLVNKVYDEIALIARYGGSAADKVQSLRQLQDKYRSRLKELFAKQVCISYFFCSTYH